MQTSMHCEKRMFVSEQQLFGAHTLSHLTVLGLG